MTHFQYVYNSKNVNESLETRDRGKNSNLLLLLRYTYHRKIIYKLLMYAYIYIYCRIGHAR